MDEKNFELVGILYEHFGLPVTKDDSVPHLLNDATSNFRLEFIKEEVKELQKGYEECDLAQIADALVDLVVVAMGTAHMHGLPWEELFNEVQRANMSKRRATHAGESKRGTALDLVKPTGWIAPRIHNILCEHGWNVDEDPEIPHSVWDQVKHDRYGGGVES
jgi:NTP pyrophosphatase (non-canonical NTP hydrolase)